MGRLLLSFVILVTFFTAPGSLLANVSTVLKTLGLRTWSDTGSVIAVGKR